MAQPAITLRSAFCLLDRFPALTGVDLDVGEGEVLLVTGANGAGKTTLLRLLAGLVPLAGGTATVLGVDLIRDRRSARGKIAFLGDGMAGYEDLGVRENLAFAARAAGLAPGAGDAALEEWGLTHRASNVPASLSTGERRRLALASVLVRDPRLLLLDEPHAGLDATGRALLRRMVDDAPGSGRTVVVASHELAEARAFAHREVRLSAGRLEGGLPGGADRSRATGTGPAPASTAPAATSQAGTR